MLYPLDDPALLGIPPMSYHCRLIDVTWTDDNENWPEDVRIFSLSLLPSPSFPLPPSLFFSQFANAQLFTLCVHQLVHVYMPLFPSSFLSPSLSSFYYIYFLSFSLPLPLQVCEWFHETAIDLKKNLFMTILPAVRTEQDIIPVTLKDDTLQNIGQLMVIQRIAK